tara:strand:+ start:2141 stop:2521 length:381 start_codon:yes stop_codon:yes gene_type:complete
MANKTLHNKKALLQALEQSLGVVTTACKKVGVSRVTFYDYCKTDEKFKNDVDDLANVALDFAESHLHQQIKNGVPSSTIFYLKTKGKKRGYIERTEQDINSTNTSYNVELSKEEIETINKELEDGC